MSELITLRAFFDNFIYLYRWAEDSAFVVDPSRARPVKKALQENNLNLTHILITHSHADHTGGVSALARQFGAEIINAENIPAEQCLKMGQSVIRIIRTPGHSEDSLCYYLEKSAADEQSILFSGDTLFLSGCGRVFTGDYDKMYRSLEKLASLDENTLVCPGHDYTEENLRFAMSVLPDDKVFSDELKKYRDATENNRFYTSTIAEQKKVNIFFRGNDKEVKAAVEMADSDPSAVFAELRIRKDRF